MTTLLPASNSFARPPRRQCSHSAASAQYITVSAGGRTCVFCHSCPVSWIYFYWSPDDCCCGSIRKATQTRQKDGDSRRTTRSGLGEYTCTGTCENHKPTVNKRQLCERQTLPRLSRRSRTVSCRSENDPSKWSTVILKLLTSQHGWRTCRSYR
jgi:hypothetical protein